MHLNSTAAGCLLNWIIIGDAVCFIVWRFYEAFKDPYGADSDAKRVLLRTGACFSSRADAFIALSALSAVFSTKKVPVTGEPVQQRRMVSAVLQWHGGITIIVVVGIVIVLTAFVLLVYGLSKSFAESININDFNKKQKFIVHAIAYAGYFSGGVIPGIIGFFFIKAAIEKANSYVVNTDTAFNIICEHIGHPWFILIAIETVSYGGYLIILGLHYKVSRDKSK